MEPTTGTRRGRPTGGRSRATLVALLLVGMSSVAVVGAEGAAAAVIPTAPDNLLVFPDRDFISIEGYRSHAGEIATVTVTRPSLGDKVVGSAQGKVSGGEV